MKVLLHLGWGLSPGFVGGTERFVINLVKGLIKKGHDAFVVCSNLDPVQTIEGVEVFGNIPQDYRGRVKQYGYANEHFFKEEVIGGSFTEESIRRFSDYVSEQVAPFESDVIHLNAFLSASVFS